MLDVPIGSDFETSDIIVVLTSVNSFDPYIQTD